MLFYYIYFLSHFNYYYSYYDNPNSYYNSYNLVAYNNNDNGNVNNQNSINDSNDSSNDNGNINNNSNNGAGNNNDSNSTNINNSNLNTNNIPVNNNNNNNNNNLNEKKVKLTYYWIAMEKDYPLKPNEEGVNIKSCKDNKQIIKKVSSQYFKKIQMEGSGLLSNNQFINCGDKYCNCFDFTEGAKGNKNNLLMPYTSIAANDLTFNIKIFSKEINGTLLPNNQVHNGCFRVDDTSWSFNNNHIDWFVYDINNYNYLDKKLSYNEVTIQLNSNCSILSYNSTSNNSNSNATTTNGTTNNSNIKYNYNLNNVTNTIPISYINPKYKPNSKPISTSLISKFNNFFINYFYN